MTLIEIYNNPSQAVMVEGLARDLLYMAICIWLVALMGIVIEISKEKPRRERIGDMLGVGMLTGGCWTILAMIFGNSATVYYILKSLI